MKKSQNSQKKKKNPIKIEVVNKKTIKVHNEIFKRNYPTDPEEVLMGRHYVVKFASANSPKMGFGKNKLKTEFNRYQEFEEKDKRYFAKPIAIDTKTFKWAVFKRYIPIAGKMEEKYKVKLKELVKKYGLQDVSINWNCLVSRTYGLIIYDYEL